MGVIPVLLAALCLQLAVVFGTPTAPLSTLSRRVLRTELRIMPLGDSITRGSLSTNTNGYRGPLQKKLNTINWDFIGTLADGTMKDPSHQGHSGKMISDIASYSLESVGARPNLILLHAGTNDVDLQRDIENAPDRLAALVDQLLKRCPDATVLVAQIIGSKSADLQARIDRFNDAVAALINSRAKSGKHVALVDMSRILDPSKDLADNKHPNDSGYAKMAEAWFAAIEKAEEKEWFGDPLKPEVTVGVGLNNGEGGSSGNVQCDGPRWVKHENAGSIKIWEGRGQIFDGYPGSKPENVLFSDVTGAFSLPCNEPPLSSPFASLFPHAFEFYN